MIKLIFIKSFISSIGPTYYIGDIVEGTLQNYTERIFIIGDYSYLEHYVIPLAEYREKQINSILNET